VGLAPKPFPVADAAGEVGPQQLHRDPLTAPALAQVDDAHPARAEAPDEAPGTEPRRVAGLER
jgi:hypothetical protein